MSEEKHRTTTGQSAIWLADQLMGQTGAYNASLRLSIEGDIDRRIIERSCERFVSASPSLRLRMGLDADGDVVQWTSPTPPPVNWLPSGSSETLDHSIAEPFDAEGGALSRLAVAQVHERRTDVVIVCHHAVIDGVSQAILANTFLTCLDSAVTAPEESRYRELVSVVRDAEEKSRAEDRDYWRASLENHPPAWPVSVVSSPGTRREFVPDECLASFRSLASALGVSLSQVVLGAIKDVFRGLGLLRTAICIAASVRPRDGSFDDVAGYFANLVPLTAAPPASGTLAELVKQLSPSWRAALRRRNYPLMALAHEFSRSVRLDRVIVSFRQEQCIRHHCHGALHVTADLFNSYFSPQTDLCLRFMPQGDRVMYEVQWSGCGPAGLGQDFTDAFRSYLIECGAER